MPRRSDTSITSAVGNRLRTLREQRGMTQAQLAEAAGLQAESISRIETGHRGLSIANMARLADALSVGLGDLIDEARPLPPTPLSAEEADLVERWKRLLPRDKKVAARVIEALEQIDE